MLSEFRAYTEPPIYKADRKRDTTYMERFTMDRILDFNGRARGLTILARGYLFADAEDWQFKSDFRELQGEFP